MGILTLPSPSSYSFPASLPQRRQFLVDGLDVERFGFERSPPFQHFLVLLVLRISDGGEVIGVAPSPAAIFWWAGSVAFDATGILRMGIGVQYLLDLYD